jgi:hypothetical protein
MVVVTTVSVVTATMSIITAATAIITTVPVAMEPRIIPRPVIAIIRIGRCVSRIAIIGIAAVITGAVIPRSNPNTDADVNSGISLAGEAQHSQQRND